MSSLDADERKEFEDEIKELEDEYGVDASV